MTDIAFSRPWYDEAEARAAADTVRSLWVTGGANLANFERRAADLCGAGHAVGVSSWTAGGQLVLHAWGIGPGDEVIVPSLTFIASVNVIRHVGAKPVFADVDPRTWNIDPADVAAKVTPATKAIIAVDQLGMPCDIDGLGDIAERHGLKLLDDAACAFGSLNRGRSVGALAEATVFSLHARKPITTGEGGLIMTDDEAFADRLRRLRHQGMSLSDFARRDARPTQFESHPEIGYNFRITDIQAAIGLAQLDKLPTILQRRRAIAARYTDHLRNHSLLIPPHVPDGMAPNWQSYQATIAPGHEADRNRVMDLLFDAGVPTRRGVMASHLEAPYADCGATLPNTEHAARATLQLPMHPGLTSEQQDHVLEAIDQAAKAVHS